MIEEIHWEITNKCNLSCLHCLPDSGSPRKNELDIKEIEKVMVKFKDFGVKKIFYTGGEPFSRPDFLDILKLAKDLKFNISILSNGTLIDMKTLTFLKRNNISLSISIEAGDSEKHDQIRGSSTFEIIIKLLKQSSQLDIPIEIYMTVNKSNLREIRNVGKMCKKYSCPQFHIKEIEIEGRAKTHSNLFSLDIEDKEFLNNEVRILIEKDFNEDIIMEDISCWIDCSVMFISSEGCVYPCVEIFNKRPELFLGNISDVNMEDLFGFLETLDFDGFKCPYKVIVSDSVTVIQNLKSQCPIISIQNEDISSIEQFYSELEILNRFIHIFCKLCYYPSCMGNLWLLKEESNKLFNLGVSIIELNENVDLINNYDSNLDSSLNLSVSHPKCKFHNLITRKCSIYKNRPLICRLYPVGLETTEEGIVVWGLHKECYFYDKLQENNLLLQFKNQVTKLINRINPILRERIIKKYKQIYEIYYFPEGPNKFEILYMEGQNY